MTKKSLQDLQCVPCRGEVDALTHETIEQYLLMLDPHWKIEDRGYLYALFRFKNFKQAMDFALIIAECAEEQNHHPDLNIAYGRVEILLWTHTIAGLTLSDMVLASKIDALILKKNVPVL